MIVVIDVSEKQKETVYDLPKTEVKEAAGAGSLLLCLDELLRQKNVKKQDLEGVAVVLGQGRFTSTRSATILANSFSYTHKIPIAVFSQLEIGDEKLVRQRLAENTGYLLPSYYAEPNITQKKN